MGLAEGVAVFVGVVTIFTSAISIGVWVGLRRAEAKRIVKVEEGISKLTRALDSHKEKIEGKLDDYLTGADSRYARKDVIEIQLRSISEKQTEMSEAIKQIRDTLQDRRKGDVR